MYCTTTTRFQLVTLRQDLRDPKSGKGVTRPKRHCGDMEDKTWELDHVRVGTNKYTHDSRDFESRPDKRGISSSWRTTLPSRHYSQSSPAPRFRHKIIMSSDAPSRLASPKARKSTTRTKKSTSRPTKPTKGDHPSWKDIIRVSRSTVCRIDFTDYLPGMHCCSPRGSPERCFP